MRSAIILCAYVLCSACASSIAQTERPAVIVNPTAETRTDLLNAVIAALNNSALTLADDALTRDSVLIIEPARPRDAQGRLLDGRDLGMPERFRLVKQDSQCVLIHERSQQRQTLGKTACRAL